jgi:hypothetical protein
MATAGPRPSQAEGVAKVTHPTDTGAARSANEIFVDGLHFSLMDAVQACLCEVGFLLARGMANVSFRGIALSTTLDLR